MPIYKDKKNGKYFITFYYKVNGVLKRKKKEGFLKRKDAMEYMNNFLIENETQKHSSILFEQLLKNYIIDFKARLKRSTSYNKEKIILKNILPYFKGKPIDTITILDIKSWQNKILSKNFKETYQHTINNQVNAIFNYAFRYYNLKKNPIENIPKIGKKNASEMRFWTPNEFFEFREALNNNKIIPKNMKLSAENKQLYKNQLIVIFNLFFYSGIRKGELLALTLDDFDFKNNTVSINKTYIRIGQKDIISTPKTPKSKRIIPIPSFIATEVIKYSESLYDYKSNQRLFTITKYHLMRQMNKAIKLANVKKIKIHELRHSHVSMLINMGDIPILVISERLGHENPQTTLKIYGHLYPNRQKEIINKLTNIEDLRKKEE